jgi:riboflavin biosynthesis pyrimidine reductase
MRQKEKGFIRFTASAFVRERYKEQRDRERIHSISSRNDTILVSTTTVLLDRIQQPKMPCCADGQS